jgi:hypothetical protein
MSVSGTLYDDRNAAESYMDEKGWDEAERDLL